MKKYLVLVMLIFALACNDDKDDKNTKAKDSLNNPKIENKQNNLDTNTVNFQEIPENYNIIREEYEYGHYKASAQREVFKGNLFKSKENITFILFDNINKTNTIFAGKIDSSQNFTLNELSSKPELSRVIKGKFDNNGNISAHIITENDKSFVTLLFTQDYDKSASFEISSFENVFIKGEDLFFTDNLVFYKAKGNFPDNILKALNDSIFAMFFLEKNNSLSIDQNLKNYNETMINDFKSDIYADYPWNRARFFDITFNENNILSIALHFESYTGGAHGNYGSSYLVFDMENGKAISPQSIMDKTAEAKIVKIIYEKIKQTKNYSDQQMTQEYELPLEISSNFYITPEGIGFFYNPYEITSFANGVDDVFLKKSEIKGLIKQLFFKKIDTF